MHGGSRKSIAISTYKSQAPIPEEEEDYGKKSIGVSMNTEKLKHPLDSRKSIAISVNTSALANAYSKRSVALSVTPEKIVKVFAQDDFSNNPDMIPEAPEESVHISRFNQSRINERNKNRLNLKSGKSGILSITTNVGPKREIEQNSFGAYKEETKEDKGFVPFKYRKSLALSAITHTPTEKEGPHSIALSAITHTPTNKADEQSENLSALHLSQNNVEEDNENKSYRSAALSAVKVFEPKNYVPAPKQVDEAIEPWLKDQTDKSIQRTVVNYDDKSVDPVIQPKSDKSISAIQKSVHEMAIGRSQNENIQGI